MLIAQWAFVYLIDSWWQFRWIQKQDCKHFLDPWPQVKESRLQILVVHFQRLQIVNNQLIVTLVWNGAFSLIQKTFFKRIATQVAMALSSLCSMTSEQKVHRSGNDTVWEDASRKKSRVNFTLWGSGSSDREENEEF